MKPKILVVDDEPDALELISYNLKAAGYDVVTAADGEEALKKARATHPSLVILDVSMPVVNGEQCLRLLQAIRRDVPVILSSGFGEAETVAKFPVQGYAGFLQKPYSRFSLAKAVRDCLDT